MKKLNIRTSIVIILLLCFTGGGIYAYSIPTLTLEDQRKVKLIEQKIKGHEAEKLKQESEIEVLKNQKNNILSGLKAEIETVKSKEPEPRKVDHKDIMSRYSTGDHYGQCGNFVNDYLAHFGIDRIFKSSKTQKLSKVNYSLEDFSKKWIDGVIAIYDVGTYGHVSIVKVIDRKLWVIDANLGGKQLISKREYGQYEYDHVIGFFNPYQYRGSTVIENVKITSYNPEVGQTDSTPCIAGGTGLNLCDMIKEGKRPIALSQDLIDWGNRTDKIAEPLKAGAMVTLKSTDFPDDPRCNGKFYVSDAMNVRYTDRGDIFFMSRSDNISCNADIYITK